jgi:succinate dehydrogenase hydrophobic anchor subunit
MAVVQKKENKIWWRNSKLLSWIAVFVFGIISFVAHWPIYPGDPSRLPSCTCLDPVQAVWFLRWVPFAISHGHNIFFTNWLNVPYGANLAQNTLMPLLGLIMSPITTFISPIASFNLIAWLAFTLSAFSMYFVIYRLTESHLSAFAAGLLYGFSPYMVGQGQVHIMLSFVPLPPLIFLTIWELFIKQRGNPIRKGSLLAIEIIAQFFIEPEILAITAIMVIICFLVLGTLRFRYITKDRLLYALKGFAVTAILMIVCLAYPVWFMVSGAAHFSGPNFPTSNLYRSDLIGLIAPTQNERFIPGQFKQFSTQTAEGDYEETGDYVGTALLIVLCVSVVYWRRNRFLLASFLLAFICWVLSLGPRLVVAGVVTSKTLPFALLAKMPFLGDILPSRFSFAEWFFIATSVALIIQEISKSKLTKKSSNHSQVWAIRVTGLLIVVLVVACLLPRWPYPSKSVRNPKLFASNNHTIAPGTVLLSYPLPIISSDQAMLWQATDNMQFKIIGGYIQNRNKYGKESQIPPTLSPQSVESWLKSSQSTPGTSIQTDTTDISMFLKKYEVGTVVIVPSTLNAQAISHEFSYVLGNPQVIDGLYLWNHVQTLLHR